MLHYPNETKKNIKKYLLLFMIGACAVLYALYITLAWLYTQASTDVLFMDGWIPFIMRIVLELIDVSVFASVYFCIIYAFFRISPQKAILFPIVYIALALLRRAISLFSEFITSGYVGSEDLLSLGLYFFFDIIQLIIVIFVVVYELRKCSDFLKKYKQAGLDTPKFLPFTSVFNKNNPLQVCSFKLAIMISGIKMVTRIISDLYYGAPESIAEALIMVAYYSADLLNGIIFYTIIWLLFSHLNKKETALLNNKAESL